MVIRNLTMAILSVLLGWQGVAAADTNTQAASADTFIVINYHEVRVKPCLKDIIRYKVAHSGKAVWLLL